MRYIIELGLKNMIGAILSLGMKRHRIYFMTNHWGLKNRDKAALEDRKSKFGHCYSLGNWFGNSFLIQAECTFAKEDKG